MKKLIALLLVFLIFTNINCVVSLKRSLGEYESLASSKVTYLGGSLDIARGEKGILILDNESIQFKYKGHTLDIPYDKITFMQYDKKLKKVLLKIPDPHFWTYTKVKMSPSFWVAMLSLLGTLAIGAIVFLMLKSSKQYVYFTAEFNINNKDEWVTFKIQRDAFDSMYSILKDKTGLE